MAVELDERTFPADETARAAEIGAALQSAVAARIIADPAYGASLYAVAIDALASSLLAGPSIIVENGPLLRLIVDIHNYVVTGDGGDDLSARIVATFGVPDPQDA